MNARLEKSAMRDIVKEYKMAVRVPWEVDDLLNRLESRVKRQRETWQTHSKGRKKPTRAGIVAAMLLMVDAMSPEEQDALLSRGMARLNALIEDAPAAAPTADMEKPVNLKPSLPAGKRGRSG